MWPCKEKVCTPLRPLWKAQPQPWAFLHWLKGNTKDLYYRKSGNRSMYIIFTQEEKQQFSSLYRKREKVNWNLYTTRFCLFHLNSDGKKGEPDPWKCFCTCADPYPSYPCWYSPLLSFTFLSQFSFFLMHLKQHQCHYDIQKEEEEEEF